MRLRKMPAPTRMAPVKRGDRGGDGAYSRIGFGSADDVEVGDGPRAGASCSWTGCAGVGSPAGAGLIEPLPGLVRRAGRSHPRPTATTDGRIPQVAADEKCGERGGASGSVRLRIATPPLKRRGTHAKRANPVGDGFVNHAQRSGGCVGQHGSQSRGTHTVGTLAVAHTGVHVRFRTCAAAGGGLPGGGRRL